MVTTISKEIHDAVIDADAGTISVLTHTGEAVYDLNEMFRAFSGKFCKSLTISVTIEGTSLGEVWYE